MEIWEDEGKKRFLIVKHFNRVFKIPPFEWETEEEEKKVVLTQEADAVKFMLDYFKGLELKESRRVLEDKFGTELIMTLGFKKEKDNV